MKKIFAMIAALAFALTVSAQDKTEKKVDKMDSGMKDCVMMEDGILVLMKDGKVTDLTTGMTLQNGIKVMADGKIIMKDGSAKMLKNGDVMYMNGKMSKMKTDHSMKKGTP